jgi:hypothetical protein
MRRVRLDEDDLTVFLAPILQEQGYIQEGHAILGFEYKTRTIKKGGDYYKDGVTDKDYPGEVEVIKWIKVLIGPSKKRERDRELKDEQVEQEAEEDAGEADAG